MKARITCNSDHWLGKEIAQLFDTDFYSRSTGWNIDSDQHIKNFCNETIDYDLTINLCVGYGFRSSKLLVDLYQHCNKRKINHIVINIGSYQGFAVLHNPNGTIDLEKQLLNLTNKKIIFDHSFFDGYLDSRIINISHAEGTQELIDYPHLTGIKIEHILNHIETLIQNPYIKILNVQSKQPGMHRINEGRGPILRGAY